MPGILKFDFHKKYKNAKINKDVIRPAEQVSFTGIGEADETEKISLSENSGELPFLKVYNIPAENIIPNALQPRINFEEAPLDSLAQSIRECGILQPLSVRRLPSVNTDSPPVYELIAGERRLRAAKMAGREFVPCIIMDADKQASGELSIIENLHREDLNYFEEAYAIRRLIEIFGYTQGEAAQRLAVSQSYIANKLRLLRLSTDEKRIAVNHGLSERHVRALVRLPETELRKKALNHIVKQRMNVAAAEDYIQKLLDPSPVNRQRSMFILKDIRLFLNTISKAAELVKKGGIAAEVSQADKGDFFEISIILPKNRE